MDTEACIRGAIQLFCVIAITISVFKFFLGLSGGKNRKEDINSRSDFNYFLNLFGVVSRKLGHFLLFVPVIFLVLLEEIGKIAYNAGLKLRELLRQ